MNPFRIILAFFVLNALAIGAAIQLIRPTSYADFEIQDVAIQQINALDTETISGRPTRLTIPSVNIDIAVASGTYNSETGAWDLSKDKAHFATITPEANNKIGNTFIYGHNNKNVFAALDGMAVGDKAVVATDTGHTFTYTLQSIKDVEPTDVSLFEYRGSSMLTIQTCSGNWFEKRRLFGFSFSEVK